MPTEGVYDGCWLVVSYTQPYLHQGRSLDCMWAVVAGVGWGRYPGAATDRSADAIDADIEYMQFQAESQSGLNHQKVHFHLPTWEYSINVFQK